MPVRAQLVSHQLVRFSGLDASIPKSRWRMWLADVAERWLERIAEDFAEERGAGRALKRNTPEYEKWKEENAFDPRRGHKEGHLQDALDEARWYRVSAVQGNGTATIQMNEAALIREVDYAEHYQAAKVVGGKLLHVSRAMAREGEDYLNERLVEVLGREALKARRRINQRELAVSQRAEGGVGRVRIRVA